MASIIDMPIVVRSFFVSTRTDIQQSLQHHRDITDAIAAGDGELAAQAMQLHLRIAGQPLLPAPRRVREIRQGRAQA